MSTCEATALDLARAALTLIETHRREWHLRCPACAAPAGAAHADDCALALALAALDDVPAERASD